MLQQGTPARAPSPASGDGSILGQSFETELAVSTVRLVDLERDRISIQSALKTASTKDVDALMKQLSATNAAIDGEKAKIDNLKARLTELRIPPVPGIATTAPPVIWQDRPGIFGLNKDEFLGIFVFVITLPIVGAVTWRLLRRGAVRQASTVDHERFARLEQAVEAVAIEVERIGESQRYQAKLMAEKQPVREGKPARVITPV